MHFFGSKSVLTAVAVAAAVFLSSVPCGVCRSWIQPVEAADRPPVPITSNTFADIAEKALPAVVHLEMRHKMSQHGLPITEFFFNGQRFPIPDFFKMQEEEETPAPSGPQKPGAAPAPARAPVYLGPPDIASGFIIRQDGYILTNAHAVVGQDSIKVTLLDKSKFDATVVGIDKFSDLAVIKIEARDLPTLPWGSSAALRPGEYSVAIGSPLGDDHTVTMGIISAVARMETDVNDNINFIQTDAAINPGNSGGPLLNIYGEVVGINTAIKRRSQGIAFAIPSDVAKTVANDLIMSVKISRPWLGVIMGELEDAYKKGTGLPLDTQGVLIRDFVEGSPALAAGLKKYDVIQKIDGKDMLAPKDVKDYVLSKKTGDILNFIVLRDKNRQAVAVKVGIYKRNQR